jgi:YHS domain-containing protein
VPCPDVFVQDVAGFLCRKGITLRDHLDDRREAILDDEHLVRLNYEAFFFADEASRGTFLEDPVTYCGLLTDPVTKGRFRPRRGGPSVEHEGVRYYFATWTSHQRFVAEPARFVLPHWRM